MTKKHTICTEIYPNRFNYIYIRSIVHLYTVTRDVPTAFLVNGQPSFGKLENYAKIGIITIWRNHFLKCDYIVSNGKGNRGKVDESHSQIRRSNKHAIASKIINII